MTVWKNNFKGFLGDFTEKEIRLVEKKWKVKKHDMTYLRNSDRKERGITNTECITRDYKYEQVWTENAIIPTDEEYENYYLTRKLSFISGTQTTDAWARQAFENVWLCSLQMTWPGPSGSKGFMFTSLSWVQNAFLTSPQGVVTPEETFAGRNSCWQGNS